MTIQTSFNVEHAEFLFAKERAKLPAEHDDLDIKNLKAGESTLPRLLRKRAQIECQDLALREKEHGIWKRYSWGHYYQQARLFAFALMSVGIKRGDRVIIASENTPEWYYADLGAELIGAIPIGIYPTNPWPELQYIVRHCGARIAVCGDQEQTDKVLDAQENEGGLPDLERILCVDMKGMRRYSQDYFSSFEDFLELGRAYLRDHPDAEAVLEAIMEETTPDDVALMVYTSGTTGPPKGALITHRNIIYSTYNYAEAVGADKHTFEAVGYLPLCHAAERCYTMSMHLVLGGVVNFAESIDTVALNIREIAPTFFIGVPRIWEKLKENFEFKLRESGRIQRWITERIMRLGRRLDDQKQKAHGRLSFLQNIQWQFCYILLFRNIQRHLGLNKVFHGLCAGASVSPETLRFFSVIGVPISQGYGMTESAGCVFIQRGNERLHGGSGLPISGSDYKIAEDGEIWLKGPAVFKGYFLDKQATDNTFNENWLCTGDIVEQLKNGEIAVVDRKKAIIITSGGKNIAPSEIENALKDSQYIKEVIVVGDGRKFLAALIQIDYDNVGLWASERGLAYTTYKTLTQLEEVNDLVQHIVNSVNERFARVENIRKFVLLEKELDHDDGELTATQKVRRSIIDKKFASELEIIYGKREA